MRRRAASASRQSLLRSWIRLWRSPPWHWNPRQSRRAQSLGCQLQPVARRQAAQQSEQRRCLGQQILSIPQAQTARSAICPLVILACTSGESPPHRGACFLPVPSHQPVCLLLTCSHVHFCSSLLPACAPFHLDKFVISPACSFTPQFLPDLGLLELPGSGDSKLCQCHLLTLFSPPLSKAASTPMNISAPSHLLPASCDRTAICD